jgi:hypothetical protein
VPLHRTSSPGAVLRHPRGLLLHQGRHDGGRRAGGRGGRAGAGGLLGFEVPVVGGERFGKRRRRGARQGRGGRRGQSARRELGGRSPALTSARQ